MDPKWVRRGYFLYSKENLLENVLRCATPIKIRMSAKLQIWILMQVDDETKERAKAILQQVGEKIEETVEEAKRRQLQEKLAATEGIGEVVHELYNQHEDHTK